MTLRELVGRYFELMGKSPTLMDLMCFTQSVPAHLQSEFLDWLRIRASDLEAMGYKPRDALPN